jgi:septal ring factor EnvC (AmiA/AmiB activator)
MILTENKRSLFAPRASAAWGLKNAIALALLCFFAFLSTSICHAQEQSTVEWTLTLRDLESRARSSDMTDAERARLQDDIDRLERRIETWLKAHKLFSL